MAEENDITSDHKPDTLTSFNFGGISGLFSVPANEVSSKGWGAPLSNDLGPINPPLGTVVTTANPTTGGVVATKVTAGVIDTNKLKRAVKTNPDTTYDENEYLRYLRYIAPSPDHYSSQVHEQFEWVGEDGTVLVCDTFPDLDLGFTRQAKVYYKGRVKAIPPNNSNFVTMCASKYKITVDDHEEQWLFLCTFDIINAIVSFWRRPWGAAPNGAWTFISSFDLKTLDPQFNVSGAYLDGTYGSVYYPPACRYARCSADGKKCAIKVGAWGILHLYGRDPTQAPFWHGHLVLDILAGTVTTHAQPQGKTSSHWVYDQVPTSVDTTTFPYHHTETTWEKSYTYTHTMVNMPVTVEVGWDGNTLVEAIVSFSGSTVETWSLDSNAWNDQNIDESSPDYGKNTGGGVSDETSSVTGGFTVTLTMGSLSFTLFKETRSESFSKHGTSSYVNSGPTTVSYSGGGSATRHMEQYRVRHLNVQNQVVMVEGNVTNDSYTQSVNATTGEVTTTLTEGASTSGIKVWARDEWIDLSLVAGTGPVTVPFRSRPFTPGSDEEHFDMTTQPLETGWTLNCVPTYPYAHDLYQIGGVENWNFMNYRYYNGLFVMSMPKVLTLTSSGFLFYAAEAPNAFTPSPPTTQRTMVTINRTGTTPARLSSTEWTNILKPSFSIETVFGVGGQSRLKNLRLL